MNVCRDSEGHTDSNDFEFVASDDEDDDVELDVELCKENIIDEAYLNNNDCATMFWEEEDKGYKEFDNGLNTPIGFDIEVQKYVKFYKDDDGFSIEFTKELGFTNYDQLKDVIRE